MSKLHLKESVTTSVLLQEWVLGVRASLQFQSTKKYKELTECYATSMSILASDDEQVFNPIK